MQNYYISIHLMLLFINKTMQELNIKYNFNTSHVTVYRLVHFQVLVQELISIHLMLLFISDIPNSSAMYVRFQYISCYCLSCRLHSNIVANVFISIHLMLLFIYDNSNRYLWFYIFQYISCYCLSDDDDEWEI